MTYSSIYNMIGFNNEVDRLKAQVELGWKKEFRTLKWLGLRNGMDILDIGGGPGFYSEKILENLPNSKVTIVDIDDKLLRIAKDRLSNYYYNNRITFEKTSIYKTGIKDNTYDFVICRFVLQHLDKPVEAVREIYRILKPGGIVAIIDSDSGLMGISDPSFLIKSGRSFFQELEKRARWNREIGRKLIKILKVCGYNDLDFEAVTIHSDIIGMKNILKIPKVSDEQMRFLMRYNPSMYAAMSKIKDGRFGNNYTIILLNLIAKGVKL
ncbi:MAG: class I SAM-dependent methyltransferase [Clostridium sp.]|nr:class I SAM-dependent methyltransferase [Clostridium sp.]